jgi:hypothetical protein
MGMAKKLNDFSLNPPQDKSWYIRSIIIAIRAEINSKNKSTKRSENLNILIFC